MSPRVKVPTRRKRPTKRGLAIRKGIQRAKVERFLQEQAQGLDSNSLNTLREMLTQNMGQASRNARSKRIMLSIKNNNWRALGRFKEFKSIKSNIKELGTESINIRTLDRALQPDGDWYMHNRELIVDSNSLNNKDGRLKINKQLKQSYKQYQSKKSNEAIKKIFK